MIYARRDHPHRQPQRTQRQLSRRQVLQALAAGAVLSLGKTSQAAAEIPQHLQALVNETTGGITPKEGKIRLTLPTLAESGNSVPLKIQVESPMTASDHVQSIHVFSARNPRPVVARFYLSPHSGKAEVSTRIRLAGTQRVVVVAIMSDGSPWLNTAEVVVTAAACVDD